MNHYMPIEKNWNYHIVVWPIVIFLAAFIIWATVSEIDEQVKGQGKVVPSSQTQVLQNLEGGIIKKIYVQEGARVQKGDPIYKLQNTATSSDSKKKEIELAALEAQKMRLESQISFDTNLDFKDDNEITQNEKEIFISQMENYHHEMSMLQNTLDENRLKKKKQKTHLVNLNAELKIAKENLKITQNLESKGAASKQQYLLELSKKQSIVTQMEELKSSFPILGQQIKASLMKLKTFKSKQKTKWLKELNEVNLKIEKLTQTNIAATDRESRKIVKSPVNGVVQKLYFHTIGGITKPGDNIAEITPIDDALVIESKIKTRDRGDIWVDQNVSIEITAYNYARYGLLKGKVISISPDSFTDRNGASFYQVKVRADNYQFADDKPILPGMIARISIKTGSKTIMEYILKPLKDIQKNALIEK